MGDRAATGADLPGFIVGTEPGIGICYDGETAIVGDLELIADLYRPAVGLLGCGQPVQSVAKFRRPGMFLAGELSPSEEALAAEFLGMVGLLDGSERRQAVGESLVVETGDVGARAVGGCGAELRPRDGRRGSGAMKWKI